MAEEISFIPGGVTAPQGFCANGIHCGIRRNKSKKDLALIVADTDCAASGIYTRNLVCGAPITVTRAHIADGKARAVICNSGIANTCEADGVEKAEGMCARASQALGIPAQDFIVASTGVIGQPLDLSPIENGMAELTRGLTADASGSDAAAQAIMTTDTHKKEFAVSFTIGGKPCKIGAIAKGSGMIHPNMATMLCFITTDAAVAAPVLEQALRDVADETFHMMSIDGDTSTNDTVCIMASGHCGNAEIVQASGAGYEAFYQALLAVCRAIVRELARDGEGATKLIVCRTHGAKTLEAARKSAKSVICSSLVKAAMFGSDANWGRILCAIGYSGADVDVNTIDVKFVSSAGEIEVCKNGAGIAFSEELAKKVLTPDEIIMDVSLGSGDFSAEAYGCDLTYDYVKINGDYRT